MIKSLIYQINKFETPFYCKLRFIDEETENLKGHIILADLVINP